MKKRSTSIAANLGSLSPKILRCKTSDGSDFEHQEERAALKSFCQRQRTRSSRHASETRPEAAFYSFFTPMTSIQITRDSAHPVLSSSKVRSKPLTGKSACLRIFMEIELT